MKFDTATLMMAGGITTAFGGVLLLLIWSSQRAATALLWWSIAYVLYAAGIFLLANGLPEGIHALILTGIGFTDTAPPLIWIGLRIFDQRPPPIATRIAIVAGWLVIDMAASFALASPLLSFIGWSAWMLLCAIELLRGRAERIPARLPLAGAFAIHGFVYAGGAYDILTGSFPTLGISPLNSWFGAIFFEGMIFAMCSTLLMVLLYRERDTARFAHEATSDPLTGIANRRAFLESAQRLLLRCQKEGAPCSLIMFDLDRFKVINDTQGHPFGDEVLRSFSDTVRTLIRPNDFFGRYGGEEFAVVLPNAAVETAFVIAERVRHAFAEANRFTPDGVPLNATVSGGVAEAASEASIHEVIQAADRALYRAKDFGRNQIDRGDDPDDRRRSNVIRVA